MALKHWRIRQQPKPQQLSTTSSTTPSKLDFILSRVANGSQIGLLVLAAFGYWYTVIPVYQKSLLDEQIAQKTIELNTKDAAFKKGTEELAALNAEVAAAKVEADKSRGEAIRLRGTVEAQYQRIRTSSYEELMLATAFNCTGRQVAVEGLIDCVKREATQTRGFAGLSANDKKLVLALLDAEKAAFLLAAHDVQRPLKMQRDTLKQQLDTLEEKCPRDRKGDLSNQCSASIASASYKVKIADLDIGSAADKVLVKVLIAVAKRFGVKVD